MPPSSCFLGHLLHFSSAGLQLQLLEEGLVVLRAVGVTGAGPDDHDWFLDSLPGGALKLHLDGFGVVGGAAPTIAADPTEPGLIGMQASAILELQVDGFQGLLGAETLFTFLVCRLLGLLFTRPNHTKTSLLYHLTLAIPVGDPGGQAHPTALGTCAPLCGLLDAVDTGVRDFDSYGGFWSVGWKGQASQGPLLIWATGPLFTALSRHCNFSWSWAVGTWQQHIQLAAGHAANLPISAGAVVLTVWFKLLSAAVDDPIEHTVVSL